MKSYQQLNRNNNIINKAPRILAVFAHPDDESFLMGGTLAHYALNGVEVELLCLTRGEKGYSDHATEDERQRLPLVRESELARSCEILGVQLLPLLDFPDGKLTELPFSKLAQPIANTIRLHRPDIVLTFGPEGLTGHPDHIAIYHATTLAFQVAAKPGAALFYGGLSERTVQRLSTRLEGSLGDNRPLGLAGAPYIELDTTVSISHTNVLKWAALESHRSQSGGWESLNEADYRLLGQAEHFRLVHVSGHAVRPARLRGPAATDLFERAAQSIPVLRTA